MSKQADGNLLIGGDFTRVADVTRFGIARLINSSGGTILFDFDGDRRADISVFRPSAAVWYRLNSSNNSIFDRQFGSPTD